MSATETDGTGSGHSSIKSKQGDDTEGCQTAVRFEPRSRTCRNSQGSLHCIFYLGQTASNAGPLLALSPSYQRDNKLKAEFHLGLKRWVIYIVITNKTTTPVFPVCHNILYLYFHKSLSFQRRSYLTKSVQKSEGGSSILQSPELRPAPRPPVKCPGTQFVTSCHHPRTGPHSGLKSSIYRSSSISSSGQQVHTFPSSHLRLQVETSLSQTPPSSKPFKKCSANRRQAFSFGITPRIHRSTSAHQWTKWICMQLFFVILNMYIS